MKSTLRAALVLGALSLASSQASASSINVYDGMSPVTLTTYNMPTFDPLFVELNVTATAMLTRLIDTSPDAAPLPSWKVSYDLYKDGTAGAGYSLGALVDSFSFTDATFSSSNPSAWWLTNIATTGEYVLKISTDGASSSTSQVSAVPLPAAAWLFGSALLGAGALRRKQKSGEKSEMAAA